MIGGGDGDDDDSRDEGSPSTVMLMLVDAVCSETLSLTWHTYMPASAGVA